MMSKFGFCVLYKDNGVWYGKGFKEEQDAKKEASVWRNKGRTAEVKEVTHNCDIENYISEYNVKKN